MNTTIKTSSITLSAAVREYLDKRLEKVRKLVIEHDGSLQCDVELARTTDHHRKGDIFKAEIHIVGAGRNLYAQAERPDLYSAIDGVQREILAELKASKGKRVSLVRRSGARLKNIMKGLWPRGANGQDGEE
ncbi:MAG: ribosome-associated translation inhibitor RaiA [Patescibacteria group bacterium]|nr:ribosome-associated translation inhibitor RaiA [Patescibacteria group bacterium]